MRESIEDQQFPREQQFPDSAKAVLAAAVGKQAEPPRETELVIIALLMRIYDVQSALLAHFDEVRANEVYDTHAVGEHFNPEMFIPSLEETRVDEVPGPVA
jgi:hypothetical protein